MHVKTQFSIKDLENLSGVKAHTIRIWEKRYNLLAPDRTDTNIRKYDLTHLKKLLNVTFLYNEGYKISKIATFKEREIMKIIAVEAQEKKEGYALTSLKTAMFDFDQQLFARIYNDLLSEKSFRNIFFDVFLPLLNEIGLLWQTGSIDPAHERFISELIKQKVILQIEKEQHKKIHSSPFVFTLFLPHHEIHEIGLLYTNYEILSHGFNSIYLGANIPVESLKHVTKHHDKITFLSYFTVKPDQQTVEEYINKYQKEICREATYDLWLMGAKVRDVDAKNLPNNIRVYKSITEFVQQLGRLKK